MPDVHTVTHNDLDAPGCWADSRWSGVCGAPAVTDVGLCGEHYEQLRQDVA